MRPVSRRGFVQAVGATAGAGWLAPSVIAQADVPDPAPDRSVHLSGEDRKSVV